MDRTRTATAEPSRPVSPEKSSVPLNGDDNEDAGSDLFGDDAETKAAPAAARSDRGESSDDDDDDDDDNLVHRRNPMEYEEEEGEEAMQMREEAIAEMVLPKIPQVTASDGRTWVLRLPPSVHVDSTPFHAQLYRDEQEPKQAQEDAEARERKGFNDQVRRANALDRMHNVQNTIRWKWVDGSAGAPIRKSNARVIKWSDGTSSLQIGEEMWDVDVTHTSEKGLKPFQTSQQAQASQAESQSQSQPKSQLDSLSQQPSRSESPAIGAFNAGAGAITDKAVSVIYASDAEHMLFVGDSLVTGQLGLVPVSDAVRNHQRRIQALTKSTTKQAKIQRHDDASGIAPEKVAGDLAAMQQKEHRRRLAELGIRDTGAVSAWGTGTRGLGAGRSTSPKRRAGGGASSSGPKRRKGPSTTFSSDEDDEDDGMGVGRRGGAARDYEDDGFVVSPPVRSREPCREPGANIDPSSSSQVDDSEDEDEQGDEAESEDGDRHDAKPSGSRSKSKSDKAKRRSTRDFDSDSDEEEEAEAEATDGGENDDDDEADDPLERAEREAEAVDRERRRAKEEAKKRERSEAKGACLARGANRSWGQS